MTMEAVTRRRPALRYIPFRKKDIVEMCLASGGLDGARQIRFRELCTLLQSVFHHDYHNKLEALKDSYAPLNPDRDTRKVGIFSESREIRFVDLLEDLLNRANYEKLSHSELEQAFRHSSLFKVRLDVDFGEFEEVLLFTRGESVRTDTVTDLFGLRRKMLTFSNFDRVVIYIRFEEESRAKRVHRKPGTTLLKMFQNVPRADMEMLFPNTMIRMRTIDKLMIGVPALVGGGVVLTTKLGTSLVLLGTLVGFWIGANAEPVNLDQPALVALILGVGTLGSFIWRQFTSFKTRKLTFMQSLTENLYFKNLDNNAGVFHRLIDDAEEEDCKEAILAYYFLLTDANIMSEEQLDDTIERWFNDRWQSIVDFEVSDALDKLESLGLLETSSEDLTVVDLDDACRLLERRWDAYFANEGGRR